MQSVDGSPVCGTPSPGVSNERALAAARRRQLLCRGGFPTVARAAVPVPNVAHTGMGAPRAEPSPSVTAPIDSETIPTSGRPSSNALRSFGVPFIPGTPLSSAFGVVVSPSTGSPTPARALRTRMNGFAVITPNTNPLARCNILAAAEPGGVVAGVVWVSFGVVSSGSRRSQSGFLSLV